MNTLLVSTIRLVLIVTFLMAGSALAQVGEGNRLIDAGDFAGAIAAFDVVIDANPNDARTLALRARAQVYYADNEPSLDDAEREALYEAALADAERATDLAPINPDPWFELARALGRMAQYRGVLQSLNLASRMDDALERTLELDDAYASAWHARGLYHVEVPWIAGGRSGLVEPSFERAIAIEPDAITHRVAFAEVLIAREAYDRAAEQLEVALSLTATTFLQERDLAKARSLQASLP